MTKTQDITRRKMKYLEYTFHEAERMKSLGRIGVSKNYANSARQLQKYLATIKKKDVSFRKLPAGLLKDFENWLHQNGVCRNTSSAYLRCLHTEPCRCQWPCHRRPLPRHLPGRGEDAQTRHLHGRHPPSGRS